MEFVGLRVKDVDFGDNRITVRDGKSGKDRVTMLPQSIKTTLIFLHVLNRGGHGVLGPADSLLRQQDKMHWPAIGYPSNSTIFLIKRSRFVCKPTHPPHTASAVV
jgi:integrase